MLGRYYFVCLFLIDPSGDVGLSVAYTSQEFRKRMGLELDKFQSHHQQKILSHGNAVGIAREGV